MFIRVLMSGIATHWAAGKKHGFLSQKLMKSK
jgi:hypothetical protein